MLSAELAYLFRHAVMRDAAYQLQPPADRARLHALALRIVEDAHGGPPPGHDNDQAHPLDKFAEELVIHARFGRESEPALAQPYLQYLWRAARCAYRSYRAQTATELARTLEAECEPGTPLAIAAAFLLGHSLLSAGRMTEAEAPLRRAAESATATPAGLQYVARANIHLMHLYNRQGRAEEARVIGGKLASSLDGLPPGMRVSALTTLGAIARALGDGAAAEGRFLRALAIADQHALLVGASEARGALAGLLASAGRTAEAEAHLRESIRLAAQAGDARAETVHTCNFATFLRGVSRAPEAMEAIDRALHLARKVGDRFMEATIVGNRAGMLGEGRLDEADAAFRYALEVSTECGDTSKQAHWMGRLALSQCNRGRYAEAEAQFLAAVKVAVDVRDQLLEGVWLAALCLVRIATGKLDAARDDWRRAEAVLAKRDPARLRLCRDELLEACAEAGVDPAQFTSA
jgi:tetratricopeptide (TPR) repeat protein